MVPCTFLFPTTKIRDYSNGAHPKKGELSNDQKSIITDTLAAHEFRIHTTSYHMRRDFNARSFGEGLRQKSRMNKRRDRALQGNKPEWRSVRTLGGGGGGGGQAQKPAAAGVRGGYKKDPILLSLRPSASCTTRRRRTEDSCIKEGGAGAALRWRAQDEFVCCHVFSFLPIRLSSPGRRRRQKSLT